MCVGGCYYFLFDIILNVTKESKVCDCALNKLVGTVVGDPSVGKTSLLQSLNTTFRDSQNRINLINRRDGMLYGSVALRAFISSIALCRHCYPHTSLTSLFFRSLCHVTLHSTHVFSIPSLPCIPRISRIPFQRSCAPQLHPPIHNITCKYHTKTRRVLYFARCDKTGEYVVFSNI